MGFGMEKPSGSPQPETGVVSIEKRDGTVTAYQTVALRIHRFRADHPDWAIHTEIIHRDEDVCVMQARILTPQGHVLAMGHSEEFRAFGQVNRTSALENAETSAIGRALAALGYLGAEFASEDEKATAAEAEQEMEEMLRASLPALETAAAGGMEALQLAWEALSMEARRACKQSLPGLKRTATKADLEMKEKSDDQDSGTQ